MLGFQIYREKSKFIKMPNCCRIFLRNPDSRIFFEVFRRIAQLGEEQELKEQKLEEEEKERRGHRSQVECAPQEVGAYR